MEETSLGSISCPDPPVCTPKARVTRRIPYFRNYPNSGPDSRFFRVVRPFPASADSPIPRLFRPAWDAPLSPATTDTWIPTVTIQGGIMRPSLRRYSIQLLAALLLSQGALGLARAED